MQHPHLNSQKFDWDIVCPAPLWQHSHNYLHHTFTNIVGRERVIAGSDCGFGTFAGYGAVDPEIAYAKLGALSEGAARAK